jgi:hypothetical protein
MRGVAAFVTLCKIPPMQDFYRSRSFQGGFILSLLLFGGFLLWELNLLNTIIQGPPRPPPTNTELTFTIVLIILLSLNTGLFFWYRQRRSCPVGTKRATTVAGVIGAVTLLCPVCLYIPLSILGLSITLTALIPYVPLLRIVALILIIVSTAMLWPKQRG